MTDLTGQLPILSGINAILFDLYQSSKRHTLKATAALRNDAAVGFSRLIQESYERRSRVKTLVDPDTPVPLKDIYAPATLIKGEIELSEADLLELMEKHRRIAVRGTAGAGKSLLLKSIFLHVLDHWAQPIPLFVELRGINDFVEDEGSLMSLILSNIQNYVRDFTAEQLAHGLYEGKFMLLLDALDEVRPDRQLGVANDIIKLSERNRKAHIIITSRPDKLFFGWDDFESLELAGLKVEAARSIVERLPYDEEIKSKFVRTVLATQFDEHSEFLSVPLLLVMMLVVYDQFAEIPEKIIYFYHRAFEALFSRHDAMKGGYKRTLESGLTLEQFRSLFKAFCVATYASEKLSFTDEVARAFIDRAARASGLNVDSEKALRDMLRGVCVLQHDGLDVVFAHRSFQEFFTASYLVEARWEQDRVLKFIEMHGRRMARDNVVSMMKQLNKVALAEQWILPSLREVEVELNRIAHVSDDDWDAHFWRTFLDLLQIRIDGTSRVFSLAKSRVGRLTSWLQDVSAEFEPGDGPKLEFETFVTSFVPPPERTHYDVSAKGPAKLAETGDDVERALEQIRKGNDISVRNDAKPSEVRAEVPEKFDPRDRTIRIDFGSMSLEETKQCLKVFGSPSMRSFPAAVREMREAIERYVVDHKESDLDLFAAVRPEGLA